MMDHSPLSPEERRRIEGDAELLARLAGDAAERQADAPAQRHEDYQAWRAGELRRQADAASSPAELAAAADVAHRARAAMEAARARVRCVSQAPESRPAARTGAMAQVLGAASAEGYAPWLDLGVAAGAGRELWDEPCESWVRVPDDLPRGQFVALTVRGESMAPLLHSGDVVLTRLGSELRRDAMVVARRPDDGYVVKKVGRMDAESVELLSLNPEFPAVRIPRDERLVVGTVVLRWCGHE
ncbi:MAG TPA: S24 family peptidase [Gemmatimonadaceae bacterium]|nr:S24 family peptidase [Gemmatimonadaceae bacterium]